MGLIEKAREKMQQLSGSVRKFIKHYKEILGQIEAMKAANAKLDAQIKELRSK